MSLSALLFPGLSLSHASVLCRRPLLSPRRSCFRSRNRARTSLEEVRLVLEPDSRLAPAIQGLLRASEVQNMGCGTDFDTVSTRRGEDSLLCCKWSSLNSLCTLNGFQCITNTPVPCIPKCRAVKSKL